MLAEKVDLNVEAIQELPSAYCGIITQKKNDYSKVVISRVEEIIKVKGETWKSIEKAIGIEKLWNEVHHNPKKVTMQKIADYLDCNVGYFYGMDIDPFYKEQKTALDNNLLIKTLKDYHDNKITAKYGAEILNIPESTFKSLSLVHGYSKTPIDELLRRLKIDKGALLKSFDDIDHGKSSTMQEYRKFNIAHESYNKYYKAYKNGVLTSDEYTYYDQTLIDLLRLLNFHKITINDLAEYLNITGPSASYKAVQYGYLTNIEQKILNFGFSIKTFIKACSNIVRKNITIEEVAKKYGLHKNTFIKYFNAYKNGVFKEYNKTGKILQINPFTFEVDHFTEDDLNYDAIKLINQQKESEKTHTVVNDNMRSELLNLNKEKQDESMSEVNIKEKETNNIFEMFRQTKDSLEQLEKAYYHEAEGNKLKYRINQLKDEDKNRVMNLIDCILREYGV